MKRFRLPSLRYVSVDDTLIVMTFKTKTVQNVLTEIAGLLVLTRILHMILIIFHENRFNEKMKKETKEEFRDVFTYSNFKRAMLEIQEMKERLENMERFVGYQDDKVKNV